MLKRVISGLLTGVILTVLVALVSTLGTSPQYRNQYPLIGAIPFFGAFFVPPITVCGFLISGLIDRLEKHWFDRFPYKTAYWVREVAYAIGGMLAFVFVLYYVFRIPTTNLAEVVSVVILGGGIALLYLHILLWLRDQSPEQNEVTGGHHEPNRLYCEKCLQKIESRSELITCFKIIKMCAYHDKCYADDLKNVNGFVLSSVPLNGLVANWVVAICTLALLITGLAFRLWTLMPLVIVLPAIRFFSWYLYERHLI